MQVRNLSVYTLLSRMVVFAKFSGTCEVQGEDVYSINDRSVVETHLQYDGNTFDHH